MREYNIWEKLLLEVNRLGDTRYSVKTDTFTYTKEYNGKRYNMIGNKFYLIWYAINPETDGKYRKQEEFTSMGKLTKYLNTIYNELKQAATS